MGDVVIGDFIKVLAVFLVGAALFFGALVWVMNGATKIACHAQTAELTMPSRYSFFGGCQIKHPQYGWMPLENWRAL